jgi:hypothetical protein
VEQNWLASFVDGCAFCGGDASTAAALQVDAKVAFGCCCVMNVFDVLAAL